MHLHNLKSTHLKHIASLIGATSSGTKPILTTSITQALHAPLLPSTSKLTNKSKCRVMSIDMGIRNLAFCMLDVNLSTLHQSATPNALETSALLEYMQSRQADTDVLKSLAIQSWRKLELTPSSTSITTSTNPELDVGEETKAKDLYDPPHLAPLAHSFITTHLLPAAPDVVVIERQRHRSGGGRAVLEWTFRVNLLEGMLWAILHTLKHEKRFGGDVWSVSPARVSRFWEDESFDTGTMGLRARGSGKLEKERKIATVERWVKRGEMEFGEGAVGMKGAFLEAVERRPRQRRGVEGEGVVLRKVDDLADCLLQGVTWVQWEVNRRRLLDVVKFGDGDA